MQRVHIIFFSLEISVLLFKSEGMVEEELLVSLEVTSFKMEVRSGISLLDKEDPLSIVSEFDFKLTTEKSLIPYSGANVLTCSSITLDFDFSSNSD